MKIVFVLKKAIRKIARYSSKHLTFLIEIFRKNTENLPFFTAYIVLANVIFPIIMLCMCKPFTFLLDYRFRLQTCFEILEYYLLILLSIYTQEEYFSDYMSGMHRVEEKMHISAYIEDETNLLRFLNLITFFRLSPFIIYYIRQWKSDLLLVISSMIVVYSRDIALIPVIVMLEVFRHQVEALRIFTELSVQEVKGKELARIKLSRIKKTVYVYKNLYNVIEKKFNVLKIMISIKFVGDFRDFMVFIYMILNDLVEKQAMPIASGYTVQILVTGLISVVAPMLVELCVEEVDKIKTTFADQLLTCTEEEVREALQDALMYLRFRRFRCVLWRTLSVDASTPLVFLAIVTNCVTVMTQFMKPQPNAA